MANRNLFTPLAILMKERQVKTDLLASLLGRSTSYVRHRVINYDGLTFTLEEAYKILKFFDLPEETFIKIFPSEERLKTFRVFEY